MLILQPFHAWSLALNRRVKKREKIKQNLKILLCYWSKFFWFFFMHWHDEKKTFKRATSLVADVLKTFKGMTLMQNNDLIKNCGFGQQSWLKNIPFRRCQLADCIVHSGLNFENLKYPGVEMCSEAHSTYFYQLTCQICKIEATFSIACLIDTS